MPIDFFYKACNPFNIKGLLMIKISHRIVIIEGMPVHAALGLLFFAISLDLAAQAPAAQLPDRVAEEAEVLQSNAPRILTRETLEQRSLMPPLRFRPRTGTPAQLASGPRYRVREVQSEFSFAILRDSKSKDLFECRQVVSIDGQPLQTEDAALKALADGIRAGDDRSRKRMLEDFARTGLVDIATDYALILLAFTSHAQKQMEFARGPQAYIGVDPAVAYTWKQKTSEGGAVEFNGLQSVHRALQGTLWVRASDGLPLRVSAWMEYRDAAGHLVRDDATVDYFLSQHGFLTPASVAHRHSSDGVLATENLYRYDPFRLFTASSAISFGDLPDPPPVKK